MNINILILSIGRRVELVKCFREASKLADVNSKIITADISNIASAAYFADKNYIIPKIGSSDYISSIINICNKEDIRLIVPTIDTELLILSENKEFIESKTKAKVLVSDEKVIKICRDKINTNKFFEENGFGVPKQITQEDLKHKDLTFPLFIKPLDGSSSINTFKVNNLKELNFFNEYIEKPIIQEFIEGEEYTIDVFLDFDGNPITIVPRKRLATRSGEVSKGIISKDQEIIEEVRKVIKKLNSIGQITIQCMKTKNGIKFIEINPRFGGGAPMSIKAGANSPLNLYKLLKGEKLEYNENYKDNMLALRFDEAIFLNEEEVLT